MTDFLRCRYCNARIARARHYDGWAHIERPERWYPPHYAAAPTSREAVVRRSPRRRPTASQAAGRSRAPRRAAAGGL